MELLKAHNKKFCHIKFF